MLNEKKKYIQFNQQISKNTHVHVALLIITGITLITNTSESKRNIYDGEKSTYLLKFLVIGLLVVLTFMFIIYKGIDLNKRCSTHHK